MEVISKSTLQAFEVEYRAGKRFVHCPHCNTLAERSIVTHLKKQHPRAWKQLIETFSELRRQGNGYKKIMWHFGRAFSWTVIERALAEAGVPAPLTKQRSIALRPSFFSEETTSLWSFENRGKWAVHDSVYRGNWAPEVPRNLILKYSKRGEWVLDPFIGGGTTAIEAFLLGRNCVGFDISPAAITLARRKLLALKKRAERDEHLSKSSPTIRLHRKDARRMQAIPTSSIQLVCAHPPYLDIIGYTRKDPADFSTITDPDRYVREMRKVSFEVFRCLKPGGVFCLLIGDVRRRGRFIPLGFKMLNALLDGFEIDEIIIKRQHQCATTPFYKSKNHSFLRLAHEYLFVLRKPRDQDLGTSDVGRRNSKLMKA